MIIPSSQKALENLLISQGIDISSWGTGQTKYLADLWNEVTAGESILLENPISREVQVVKLIIRNNDKILIEAEQVLADGRHRRRHQPPADKIKPGESIEQAAVRCLVEELRVHSDQIQIETDSHREQTVLSDSASYPGLPCRYNYHFIDAQVSDLPHTNFWVDNQGSPNDPVTKHLWVWEPENHFNIPI